MERIALLHSRLQVTLTIVMLALACWGVITLLRRGGVGRAYGAALAIGGLLALAEGLLGLLLLVGDRQPARLALHIIYGSLAMFSLPLAAVASRGRRSATQALIFAATSLFVVGVAIRAYETARIP